MIHIVNLQTSQYSTHLNLLDSTEQICTFFFCYGYYIIDILTHIAQSGAKLQKECLIVQLNLTNSDVLTTSSPENWKCETLSHDFYPILSYFIFEM